MPPERQTLWRAGAAPSPRDPQLLGHADQIRHRFRLHLLHHAGAVQFNSRFRDGQFIADLPVEEALNNDGLIPRRNPESDSG
jgi:hypothetical protein